jgi:hypothetical protein
MQLVNGLLWTKLSLEKLEEKKDGFIEIFFSGSLEVILEERKIYYALMAIIFMYLWMFVTALPRFSYIL